MAGQEEACHPTSETEAFKSCAFRNESRAVGAAEWQAHEGDFHWGEKESNRLIFGLCNMPLPYILYQNM